MQGTVTDYYYDYNILNTALVIANYGKFCLIENSKLEQIVCSKSFNARDLVVGDYIHYRDRLVVDILPRKNFITNNNKNIVANVDLVIIMSAIRPYPNLFNIDNYLAKAHSLSITPIIILNKIDLKDNKNAKNLLKIYQKIGYKTLATSVYNGLNINKLKNLIANNTCVFVGQSGVGKSSLIGKLTNTKQRISGLNAHGLGRHTTTNNSLLRTNNNGKVIDTPGVRQFNVANLNINIIKSSFVEFNRFVSKCKFTNCYHINESQCEIKKQVVNGSISKYRYQNYLNLLHTYNS